MVKSECCKDCCNKIIGKKNDSKKKSVTSMLLNNLLLILSIVLLLYGILTFNKDVMIQTAKSVTTIGFIGASDLFANNFKKINFSDDRYTFIMGTALATSIYHLFIEGAIKRFI